MKIQDANLIEVTTIRIIKQLISKDELKDFDGKNDTEKTTPSEVNANLKALKKADKTAVGRKKILSPRIWIYVPCKLALSINLLTKRAARNLTRKDMSILSEVPVSTISNYERGVNKFVRRCTLDKLAHTLGVNASDLLKVS